MLHHTLRSHFLSCRSERHHLSPPLLLDSSYGPPPPTPHPGEEQVEAEIQSTCHNIQLLLWQIDLSQLWASISWWGVRACVCVLGGGGGLQILSLCAEQRLQRKQTLMILMTDDRRLQEIARFHQEALYCRTRPLPIITVVYLASRNNNNLMKNIVK